MMGMDKRGEKNSQHIESGHGIENSLEIKSVDKETGGGGGEEAKGVHAEAVKGDSVHDLAGLNNLRDNSLAGRHHEGHDSSLEERVHDQDPPRAFILNTKIAGGQGDGDTERNHGGSRLADLDDGLFLKPVGESAAVEGKDDSGDGVSQGHHTEHSSGTGKSEEEEGAGDHLHVHGRPLAGHTEKIEAISRVFQGIEGADITQ